MTDMNKPSIPIAFCRDPMTRIGAPAFTATMRREIHWV
ncbi:hypothetical protein ATN83_1561 [Raoultella ornithinolytica]|nr:hypothetical protein ATN83_1561 [Raoultella ornithinolytica]KDV92682.1 hypothetical protein AB00_3330 [Raoultella ornithinolytica 2-156-04_S1_C1]KDX13409.1 hypothetical protein AB28_3337 [Raoultella ornithinolytica 2-156-04_S1_C2]